MVTPDLGLFFPAVGYMEMEMNKTLKKYPYRNLPIAVNCIFFKGFDYTAVKVYESLLCPDFRKNAVCFGKFR